MITFNDMTLLWHLSDGNCCKDTTTTQTQNQHLYNELSSNISDNITINVSIYKIKNLEGLKTFYIVI